MRSRITKKWSRRGVAHHKTLVARMAKTDRAARNTNAAAHHKQTGRANAKHRHGWGRSGMFMGASLTFLGGTMSVWSVTVIVDH